MRQHKTSKKNRDTYIYYSADSTKYELKPGVDGVTEMNISMLHQEDDDEYNAQRRNDYHTPYHLQAFGDEGDGPSEDYNRYLTDNSSNPETILIQNIEHAEMISRIKAIWDKLKPNQRDLIKKKAQGCSNVDIAAEKKVTEAAIRKQLKKIQAKLKDSR